MKENADKYLDDLTRKVVGRSTVEKPSLDFTTNVMDQIKTIANAAKINYRPLISKPIWFLIGLLSVASIGYIVFGPKSKSEWIPELNLEKYFSVPSFIPEFNISQTTFYVVILFAVMLSIQMFYLKRQLHKPYDKI